MLCVGEYRVNMGAALGHGAFGFICRGEDKHGRDVATKRIDFTKYKNKVPEVSANLKKLVGLEHENIAQIFHVETEEATVWVFMELCNHGDLVNYLQRDEAASSISDNEKLKLMLDIAKGVEYLHSKNVIHRDVKPNNILVNGSPATAKLTDFDCGKFLEEDYSTSMMTSNVGTQAFKAPEFYLRTDDHKLVYHRNVDVYAMGLSFLGIIQNNPHLIPKLETPNEASELIPGYTIGMLMAERKRYNVEPLHVVKISESGESGHASETESGESLWNAVRAEILTMTHVEPKERACASEVVQSLEILMSAEKVASPPVKAAGLVHGESGPDAMHMQLRNVVCRTQSFQSENAGTSAPEEHDEPSQLEHIDLTETDPPDSDPLPADTDLLEPECSRLIDRWEPRMYEPQRETGNLLVLLVYGLIDMVQKYIWKFWEGHQRS